MDETTDAPMVGNAETVNVGGGLDTHMPYAWVIAAVTFIILLGFAIVTYVVLDATKSSGIDAATKGAILQTWNNLAVMAAGFWVGSSLGGKMRNKA